MAFYKAQDAAKAHLPTEGTVLLTVCVRDRSDTLIDVAKRFRELGFNIKTTEGTGAFLAEQGIESDHILKMHEGRPNIADGITNGEIQLIVNTPSGKLSVTDDSYIRKTAISRKVPYITTVAAAKAAAEGIAACRDKAPEVRPLQSYHSDLA